MKISNKSLIKTLLLIASLMFGGIFQSYAADLQMFSNSKLVSNPANDGSIPFQQYQQIKNNENTYQSKILDKNIRVAICKDMLSRMKRDFFHYESEEKNIKKLMIDCVFNEVDLNNDEQNEMLVKLNWFSEGRFNISKGHNYVRGAQDQGHWHIYSITNEKPLYLGTLCGDNYEALSSSSSGYRDIKTYAHCSYDERVINVYKYSGNEYLLISSILYKNDKEIIEIYK